MSFPVVEIIYMQELGTISYVRCLSDTEAIGPLFNNSRLQHLLTESDKHAVSDVEIRKNGMSLRGESADGSTDTTIKAELTKRDGRSPSENELMKEDHLANSCPHISHQSGVCW
ncbi:hypothetical protein CSKR_108236 [Clonorchis sinensis]|uniref:Uncharacterized protein n=1 Tax=Clonorchis sinensis TaxID=79923 RepID=A0A3R7JQX4_CLOSI|nr:hypothetical protein CSKR_108236 [Clonorchis sinensis]